MGFFGKMKQLFNKNVAIFIVLVSVISVIVFYGYQSQFQAYDYKDDPTISQKIQDLSEANGMMPLAKNQLYVKGRNLANTEGRDKENIVLPDGTNFDVPVDKEGFLYGASGDSSNLIIDKNENDTLIKTLNFTQPSSEKIDPLVKEELAKSDDIKVIIKFKGDDKNYDKNESNETIKNKVEKFSDNKNKVENDIRRVGKVEKNLYIVNSVSAQVSKNALQVLEKSPEIEQVTLDQVASITLDQSVDMIKAKEVWSLIDSSNNPIRGKGMKIAILDTGVDYTHSDLGGCFGSGCKVIAGYDYINNDPDPMDDHGHGTHVAATAAGKGLLNGVAPDAEVYAYKVLGASGSGSYSGIIKAIQAATDPNGDGDPADHVDVGSMSLGGAGNPDDVLSKAVDSSSASGVVWSVAAGNSGPGASTIGSPGTARSAVTVAAACKPGSTSTRCTGGPIATFSSRGPVIFNGEDIKKPDIAAPGVDICAARAKGLMTSSPGCKDSQHISISGTSMATPHIAGALALIREAYPTLTPQQVKDKLKATAKSLGQGYDLEGAGLVDLKAAVPISAYVATDPVLFDVTTDPSGKLSTFSKNVSVTSLDGSISTLDISTAGLVDGITVANSKNNINVPNKGTDSFSTTIDVDNDKVKSGVYPISITLMQGTATKGIISFVVKVNPTFSISSDSEIDYGFDSADKPSWTSDEKPITITNLRKDVSQNFKFTPNFPANIIFTANPATFTLSPGENKTIQTKLSANNASLANGIHRGYFSVSNNLGEVKVNGKFAKYYSLTIDTGDTDLNRYDVYVMIYNNDDLYGINKTIKNKSEAIYLEKTGNYIIWETMFDKETTDVYRVFKESYWFTGSNSVIKVSPSDANNLVELNPTGENNSKVELGDRHSYMTNILNSSKGFYLFGSWSGTGKTYFSNFSTNYQYREITSGSVGSSGEYNNNFYLLQKKLIGLTGNKTINVGTADYSKLTLKPSPNKKNGEPLCQSTLALQSSIIKTSFGPSGVGISVGLTNCGVYPMETYIFSNAGDDAVFQNYASTGGSCTSPCPRLFLSPAFTLNDYKRFYRFSNGFSASQSEAIRYVPDIVNKTLKTGMGPAVWMGTFTNTSTKISYPSRFNYPFLRQDYDLMEFDKTQYKVTQGGTIVSEGYIPKFLTLYYFYPSSFSMAPINLPKPGLTEYKIDNFAYQIKQISLKASVLARFDTTKSDPNPPKITRLNYKVNNELEEHYDSSATNTLEFDLEANGGTMRSGTLSMSTDGTNFNPVPAKWATYTSGSFSATIPSLSDIRIATFKIEGYDNSNNYLAYTFQIPAKEIGSTPGNDIEPPTVSITSPTNNQTIIENQNIGIWVNAKDNLGIKKIEFYEGDTLVAIDNQNIQNYSIAWDYKQHKNGTYQLSAKAYDEAGNVGISAPITVNINIAEDGKPRVYLNSPVYSSTVSGTVDVSAEAYALYGIKKVQFFLDGQSLGEATEPPYTLKWDSTQVSSGSHWIAVMATDNQGKGQAITPLTKVFNVEATQNKDTTPPTGSIKINQDADSTANSIVNLNLEAKDNDGGTGIGYMSFSNDKTKWSEWSAYTITASWDIINPNYGGSSTPGKKTVYAKFKDKSENSSVEYSDDINYAPSDTVAPTGTIKVNNGASNTNNALVTINSDAKDNDGGSGLGFISLSNNGSSWSDWYIYSNAIDWNLTEYGGNTGSGNKTVSAKFKDKAGNISQVATDSILYYPSTDTVPPTGSIRINNGALTTKSLIASLYLKAYDTQSGVYLMRLSNDGKTWQSWYIFNALIYGWDLSKYGGNALKGTKTVYVQFKDKAGNISQTYSSSIKYE